MTYNLYLWPATRAASLQAFGRLTRCAATLVLLGGAVWSYGCSGCTDGHATSDAGTDTSTDADTDTDGDTDADTDTDTVTLPEGFVPDAGPWDWEDLPDAGDCGQDGCRQLTFTDEVKFLEWDVWGELLVFGNKETGGNSVYIANHETNKQLELPSPYATATPTYVYYPATIYEKTTCYAKTANSWDGRHDVICADIEKEIQQLVYHRPKEGSDTPNPANYIDVYGSRIVSMGGCGEVMDSWPLCAFDIENPGTYEELAPHQYGLGNQIWEDTIVWESGPAGHYDIRAFDLSTEQFVEITDDTVGQICPRIHGSRVVYQDLKLGDGDPMGNWNHSAVFMHDLATHETTQITSGEWIAAYPDIHENIIVWADYRDSANPNNNTSFAGVQIWGYNLDTETEFQITDIPDRPKQTPRIWDDKVFVHMYKTTPGQDAIYMFDLPDGAK